MGISFSKTLKKCKSKESYRWISSRRFEFRKSTPKVRNCRNIKYTRRSILSRSLETQ